MGQILLFPDARPLDERLTRNFFLTAPPRPGVYLMRDAQDRIVYIGKAKDLRQRLGHYRLANPDRMPRRHLRMVNEVTRIELQFCATESAALKHERKLIRSLKPKFNRAGVWPGKPRFIAWRTEGERLEISMVETPMTGWQRFGPLDGGARDLHRSIVWLLWLALNPERPVTQFPAGWMRGDFREKAAITGSQPVQEAVMALEGFFWKNAEDFVSWLGAGMAHRNNLFERRVIESELENLKNFVAKKKPNKKHRLQLALL
jgi:predicted GIY-YIG superfamily endonuclease